MSLEGGVEGFLATRLPADVLGRICGRFASDKAANRCHGKMLLLLLLLFVRVYHRFQQFFSHITAVSGCHRELNAHFYSATSLAQILDMIQHPVTLS